MYRSNPREQSHIALRRLFVAAAFGLLSFGIGMPPVSAQSSGQGNAQSNGQESDSDSINSPEAKNDRVGAPKGDNLIALKTSAAAEVAKRQRVLDQLTDGLGGAAVDCGQNALLATRVADTSTVLGEIAGSIAAATDIKVARNAASDLYPNTRVLSLVAPQVRVALACGELAAGVAKLNARIAAAQQTLETIKGSNESGAALVAVGPAQATVKAVPSLVAAATSVVALLPDKGDVTVLNTNTATLVNARTQVKAANAAYEPALRSVKELERLTELARKKATRSAKPKK